MVENFVSVIIPVYNGSKTLGHCLEGFSKSSYPDFECIVVDDHSSDDTISVAESFRSEIIRLHKQGGAAHARNKGAEAARGDILLFVDADVRIHPDCLDKVVNAFTEDPDVSALFGSYDDEPENLNFFSQYKNLFHHFIHQISREDASTFWSGCGAIRRDVFLEVGKFDENCRMMEDIELGYKLKARNHKIRLIKDLLVKHLKHYSFTNLLKSDVLDRAVPWTMLMLKNRQFTSDLNLKPGYKLSALTLVSLMISAFLIHKSIWFVLAIPVLMAIYFLMNYEFYRFFLKKKGPFFTLKVIPLHFLYYLYSSVGFLMGCGTYLFDKYRARR